MRTFWIAAALSAVVGIASIGSLLLWASTARPASETSAAIDYFTVLKEHAANAQKNPEQAIASYQHLIEAGQLAADAYELHRDQIAMPDLIYASEDQIKTDLDRASREAGLRVVRQLDGAEFNAHLDALVLASESLRDIQPSDDGSVSGILLPELSQARQIARVLAARMHLARMSGETAAYLSNFERLLALGRHSGSQPFIIDRLVGNAIQLLAIARLDELLEDSSISSDTLHEIGRILDRQQLKPSVIHHIDSERINTLDIIQRTHARNGIMLPREFNVFTGLSATDFGVIKSPSDNERFFEIANERPALGNILAIAQPRASRTTDLANDEFQRLTELTTLNAPALTNALNDHLSSSVIDNPVLSYLIPGTYTFIRTERISLTRYNAARLRVAIHHHRATTGAYPASLEQLAPASITQIPTPSIYDADDTFNYRSIDGTTYTLSLDGPDLTDDNAANADPNTQPQRLEAGQDWFFTHPSQPEPVSG